MHTRTHAPPSTSNPLQVRRLGKHCSPSAQHHGDCNRIRRQRVSRSYGTTLGRRALTGSISGLATITELTSRPAEDWKKIIAISRSEPRFDHQDDRIVFKSVDLLGPKEKLVSALKEAGAEEADYVFFYAYIAKEDEQELIDINQVLFRNVSNTNPC
jgi:hypothetical protein